MAAQSKTLSPKSITSSPSPSDFAFTVTETAVSQICQYAGFKSSTSSALQTLTRIATIYLQSLARIAAAHANNSNRTDSNLFDVIVSLEDLASVEGFRGASNDDFRNKCMLNSSTLTDLMNYVDYCDEVPFDKPIPRLYSSVRGKRDLTRKNYADFEHISRYKWQVPPWLPPFPDPATYEIKRQSRVSKCFTTDNLLNGSLNDSRGKMKDDDRRRKREMELPEKRVKVRFKFNLKRGVKEKRRDVTNFDLHK